MLQQLPKCIICKGIGQIPNQYQQCPNCKGKKCIQCRGRGFISTYWQECPRCLGYGVDSKDSGSLEWDRHNCKKNEVLYLPVN